MNKTENKSRRVNIKAVYSQCYYKRRCKLMSCDSCKFIRRSHFIDAGVSYVKKHCLNYFVTVNFTSMVERLGYEWDDLYYFHNLIWGKFKRHGLKFIRCLSMDTDEYQNYLHPHIHLILNAKDALRYIDIAKEYSIRLECKVDDRRAIYDTEGVLGYMFDQNFIVTQLLKSKPRGIRLLRASKGLKCSFPQLSY